MGSGAEHKKLKNDALEWLALAGYFAWPNETGGGHIDGRFIRFGKPGSGDILAVLGPDGKHAEFEAKTGRAVQRKGQKTHQRMVEKRGGLYLVFRSVDDLADQLACSGYPPPQNGQSVNSQSSQPSS
ncbi:MAG: hypothetical protein U0835_00305 [Isosphaeraceae bacterium]